LARLAVDEVTVRFGGRVALDQVSLAAEPGQVTGLIGPNGAGKTTMLDVMSGLLSPASGRVSIDERDVSRLSPYRRARLGMARTFQRLELFGMLSVRDNLLVAAETQRLWAHARDDPAARVDGVLDSLGLADMADVAADSLPTGFGRRVELGRALATQPAVLLLDEPASGQSDDETDAFGRLIRGVADSGVAVVLVEHDMRLVMGSCDVVHVLNLGRLLAVGSPEVVQQDEAVLAAYLGGTRQ
jgi:branched-chain amino acid transport system ATP-binding protein